jgi:hypothetical protein
MSPRARAGGPLIVGGTFFGGALDAHIFTFSTTGPVAYRTDGGGLGLWSNTAANARVQAMFQVWQDVPTAGITFNRVGAISAVPGFSDGDVSTVAELDAVAGSCGSGAQSPVVYDADGSLFAALFGPGSAVIGFAGPCVINSAGRIVSSLALLNGGFLDGGLANGELTENEFEAVFIHEFGHFFGLDHAQANVNCLFGTDCASFSDDVFGLPTMFPFLLTGLEESPGVHPARTLAEDDRAWVSRLYPAASFAAAYGAVAGVIRYSDGLTHAQGANVVLRRVDDTATPGVNESRRHVVSAVSGYLFTGNPGQSVTGTNAGGDIFGSRNPARIGAYEVSVPPGSYTVEVEEVFFGFVGGSGVGPMPEDFALPGPAEFYSFPESNADDPAARTAVSVSAGVTTAGIDIILNGTPPRFDSFESSAVSPWRWREPAPARRRASLAEEFSA